MIHRVILYATFSCLVGSLGAAAPHKNVVFIGIDDLRPALGCYGAPVKTPNIDRLAKSGVQFDRAYCQVAVCGSSRIGVMTSMRPPRIDAWTHDEMKDKQLPNTPSIGKHFRDLGYATMSVGKIYHHQKDDKQAWSIPAWRPATDGKRELGHVVSDYSAESKIKWEKPKPGVKPYKNKKGAAVENGGDRSITDYPCSIMTDKAIDLITRHKDKPFFLALGYRKPHLPFAAPGKYWDMYDRDTIPVPKIGIPKGSPQYAASTWHELKHYADIPEDKDPLSPEQTRELIHGYYACVSMVDEQVGRVMKALDKLGLRENTVIVLWSDHGFYLGEFGDWCKHSNYEIAVRVPMIVSSPGISRGVKTGALAELVDLYPTTCELAGVPVPDHCQGDSLVPVLKDPTHAGRTAAFSHYRKYKKGAGQMMGVSLRTNRYRMTQWSSMKTGKVEDVELYDLQKDPETGVSVAENPEYKEIRKRLQGYMAQHAEGFPVDGDRQ